MKRKGRIGKIAGMLIITVSLLGASFSIAEAAQPGEIVGVRTGKGEAVVYVQSPGEVQEISCQVGTVSCNVKEYEQLEKQQVPVKTLLMLDNSLSVKAQYREKIKEIMNTVAANRIQGEQITVAAFSDTITYLLNDSEDSSAVSQAVNGMAYIDQETYLTDVLYNEIQGWKNEGDESFRRIILVSDGVDNKVGGYTKEELYSLLKVYGCPIYTIISPSESEEASKYMSALSRMTKADSWVLDGDTDAAQVAETVSAGNQALKIVAELPENICDGTEKALRLTMNVEGQEISASAQMQMPFGDVSMEAEKETEDIPAETETQIAEEPIEETEEGVWKQQVAWMAGGAAVLLVVLLVVLTGVKRYKKQKKENEFITAPKDAYLHRDKVQAVNENKNWEKVVPEIENLDETEMVWRDEISSILVLTDMRNPSRRFEVPLDGNVIVGRSAEQGCQIVLDYDTSISRRHCEIYQQDGRLRVKDLHSKNGVCVNGKKVDGEADLENDSILTLGKVELKVRLRK